MSDLKYKNVNEYIRKCRRAADLTQEELATAIDCSRVTIASIESGNSSNMKTIQKILTYLKSKGSPEIDAHVFYTAA